jgi:esterase
VHRRVTSGDISYGGYADSDYILPQYREHIVALFPQTSVKVISGCGHWRHAQKPGLFNSIARRFCGRQKLTPVANLGKETYAGDM